MTSHPDSIDKYTALLINGAEMKKNPAFLKTCLLYTSDAADD